MSDANTWMVYTDGGSRGNPGPAAYAYVIKRPGEADIEERCFLGQSTNNTAEYTGMVKALEHARELGGRKLILHSDSELMVKQMNGQYRVKNPGLMPLYSQALKLRQQFDSVTFKHVRREYNAQADALCNEAMDDPHGYPPRVAGRVADDAVVSAAHRPDPAPEKPASLADVRLSPMLQALAVLNRSAAQWAEGGNAMTPPPADVLNEIAEILQSQPDAAD